MMVFYTYQNLELNGRLGNQLWQIAATIGHAKANGGTALLKPDWEYRRFFSVPDIFFGDVPFGAEVVDGGTDYFQQLHQFENVESEIRTFFSPSKLAYEASSYKWKELTEGRKTCVVHVRRGDYLKHPNHFPIMTSGYYHEAAALIPDDVMFIVFSDDIEWCQRNSNYLGLADRPHRFFKGVVRPVEVHEREGSPWDWLDLFMMTKADHHIISNSTFSWWGAWLSRNDKVIYPSKWFGRSVPNWEEWELAIPETWRKVRT